MKYVVNTRGGAKEIPDKNLESMLSLGAIQITKKQFEDKKYYPEYDRGPQDKIQTATQIQVKSIYKTKEREFFKTRIV